MGIVLNKGRIHWGLREFFMIFSNLIKLEDKMVIEITEFSINRKKTSRQIQAIKNQSIWIKILNVALIEEMRCFDCPLDLHQAIMVSPHVATWVIKIVT